MAEKIIIASGKGGAGKTSLTAGLAISLKNKNKKVLVIDFDIGQGSMDFVFGNTDVVNNWGDAVTGVCAVGRCICSSEVTDFIPSPRYYNEGFSLKKIKKLVGVLEQAYDYILMDAPAGVTGGFEYAAACADRAIVVSTPDEMCAKAAYSAVEALKKANVNNIRLVINRFDRGPVTKGKYFNIDEVINAVGVQLIGVVPEDKEISYTAAAGFVSFPDYCPGYAAYDRIADRILGKRVRLVLSAKKSPKKKSKKIIGILIIVFCLLIVAFGGVFATDYYRAGHLQSPVFSYKVDSSGNDEIYKGYCYSFYVEKDDSNKIIATNMKVLNRTVSAAIV